MKIFHLLLKWNLLNHYLLMNQSLFQNQWKSQNHLQFPQMSLRAVQLKRKK